MLFSIVILSFESQRTLEKCLNKAKEAISGFDEPSEIIVVENGSKDQSRMILQEFELQNKTTVLTKSFKLSKNSGTTESRNKALSYSTGEYILILDSDAYITKECLVELKRVLDEKPEVGLACPKLFYGDGRYQLSTDSFPTLKRKAQRFFNLDSIQSNIEHKDLKQCEVDYAISACWLLRRDAVDAVNGFDEKIFYSPEDVDYCIQVWKKGFSIEFCPNAEMIHDAQELSRGKKITKFHLHHLLGLFYLFYKHNYVFNLDRTKIKG